MVLHFQGWTFDQLKWIEMSMETGSELEVRLSHLSDPCRLLMSCLLDHSPIIGLPLGKAITGIWEDCSFFRCCVILSPPPPPPTVQKSSTNTQGKKSKLEQMGEQISHDMGKGEVLDFNIFDI
jgi:hypothetical protein